MHDLSDNRIASSDSRFATLMLLGATVGWGFGFTWAKAAQEAVNLKLGLPPEAATGPFLTLGVRHFAAAILMLIFIGRSRRGWSKASMGRSLVLGGLFGAALCVQHLGLGRTSEAVSAFLTSLSVLFIPLFMIVFLKKPPKGMFWIAVALATTGIWLMTGASPTGFYLGELLGLACAIVFSIYIMAVNSLVPRDDPWRMTVGQVFVAGAMALLLCLGSDRGATALMPSTLGRLLGCPEIGVNLLLSLLFPTLLSLSLLNVYQPKLDPVHVALIYLMEPIFAAAYAFVAKGRTLGLLAITGAALIITANLLVELVNALRRKQVEVRAGTLEMKNIDP